MNYKHSCNDIFLTYHCFSLLRLMASTALIFATNSGMATSSAGGEDF